jgi:hypothetical protein
MTSFASTSAFSRAGTELTSAFGGKKTSALEMLLIPNQTKTQDKNWDFFFFLFSFFYLQTNMTE